MTLYDLSIGYNETEAPKKGYIWTKDGSFIKPSNFSRSGKEAYGYCLNDNIAVRLTRSHNTCGDPVEYCTSIFDNDRIIGYLPSLDELERLYYSIMYGSMKVDLVAADLCTSCDYRIMDNYHKEGWGWILGRRTGRKPDGFNYVLGYDGLRYRESSMTSYNIIPFFLFR